MKLTQYACVLRDIGFCMVISLVLSGCGGEADEQSAADKALEELQTKYDELTQKEIDNPVQWAADDLENIGDWEYKVEEFSSSDPEELEAVLNDLGDERWEVIWIEKNADGYVVFLKKPSVSYLNKIPFASFGRFIIDDSGAE